MTGIKQLSFSITITSSGVQYCNVSYSLTYAIVNPSVYWDLFIGLYWFWVFGSSAQSASPHRIDW